MNIFKHPLFWMILALAGLASFMTVGVITYQPSKPSKPSYPPAKFLLARRVARSIPVNLTLTDWCDSRLRMTVYDEGNMKNVPVCEIQIGLRSDGVMVWRKSSNPVK